MNVNLVIGIVIGVDHINYPCKAQVRIPVIHGVPKSASYCDNIKNNNISEAVKKANLLNIEYLTESNKYITVDDDIPWYPICYPFGSKVGPSLGDLVWLQVVGESNTDLVILGWTGNIYIPEN